MKRPTLPIRRRGKSWLLELSASISDTGKKQTLTFATQQAAKLEKKKREEQGRRHGRDAIGISPQLASEALELDTKLRSSGHTLSEAVKAYLRSTKALLKYGSTLDEAVKYFVNHSAEKARSKPFPEAWRLFLRTKQKRSELYLRDYDRLESALPEWFKAKTVSEYTRQDVEKALSENTKGDTVFNGRLRLLKAFLSWSVKEEWCARNVASLVTKRDIAPRDVEIFTPDELRSLLDACRDYRETYKKGDGVAATNRLDCRDCAVPFAFLAMAGIRPTGEFSRITWSDVDIELRTIRLRSTKTKTGTIRTIHIEDSLLAWIETIPEDDRKGAIMPPNWPKKRGKVLKESGLLHSQQDILRHSYGSYYLASFGDLDALRANMGHRHAQTYFAHYHKAVGKREALRWWQVLPAGEELQSIKSA